MQTAQPLSTRDIPRLLEELRSAVQSETRRPLSEKINRLSDAIETAAVSAPTITVDEDQWARFDLSPKELALATILRAAAGKTVHKEMLLSGMYGGYDDEQPTEKIIDVWICKLNRKLAGYYRIENEHGVGARMVYLKKGRDPRDVIEWRGIFMGTKQALMAERLFSSLGRWTHTRELAKACDSLPNSVGGIIRGLKHNLLGTPYRVENVRCAGYRMLMAS